MPKVSANGIQFHYQTRGEGPDVVLIHGVTSSLAAWYNGILTSLTAAGFRVTAYDLRGHGLSDSTPNGYTSYDCAMDLRAVLDALGLDKVQLVGHSFGGAIAMHFAALNPDRVRGAILLDSAMACLRELRMIEDWEGWRTRSEELAQGGFTLEWFLEVDSQQDMTDFLRKGLAVNLDGYKKGMSSRIKRLIEETRVGYEFRDIAGLTEDVIRKVPAPFLALFGGTSPNRKMAPYLANLMPNCWHEILPEVGHFAAIYQPKVVLPRMIRFLEDPEGYVREARSRVAAAAPNPVGAAEEAAAISAASSLDRPPAVGSR